MDVEEFSLVFCTVFRCEMDDWLRGTVKKTLVALGSMFIERYGRWISALNHAISVCSSRAINSYLLKTFKSIFIVFFTKKAIGGYEWREI